MNETAFWNLLTEARNACDNSAGMPAYLKNRLSGFCLSEIVDFSAYLAMMLDMAHDGRLRAAGTIIRGGLSDDRFVYFKCWLIAQGEKVFKAAIADPDCLHEIISFDGQYGAGDAQLEHLLYVGNEAFKIRSNGVPMSESDLVLPSWQSPRGVRPFSTGLKNPRFWDGSPSRLKELLPKLAKRFQFNPTSQP